MGVRTLWSSRAEAGEIVDTENTADVSVAAVGAVTTEPWGSQGQESG